MSHVTHQWVISHVNESCPICHIRSYGKFEPVVSHMNASSGTTPYMYVWIRISRTTPYMYVWTCIYMYVYIYIHTLYPICHNRSYRTCEPVMSHMNASSIITLPMYAWICIHMYIHIYMVYGSHMPYPIIWDMRTSYVPNECVISNRTKCEFIYTYI